MNKGLLIRLFLSIAAFGGFIYTYIDRQNDLTELKMAIPELIDDVRGLKEENAELCLEIERIEHPSRLIELLREQEFSHLHFPYLSEVMTINMEEG
ncbi:MAG: hypothetical protein KDK60_02590 [Chlamydiia bacterium]|nr:hypothetical protein [Chlamydiia bacterium]